MAKPKQRAKKGELAFVHYAGPNASTGAPVRFAQTQLVVNRLVAANRTTKSPNRRGRLPPSPPKKRPTDLENDNAAHSVQAKTSLVKTAAHHDNFILCHDDPIILNQMLQHTLQQAITSGGLRGDPFNSYPIPTQGLVPSAVDYFNQYYAPVHIGYKAEQNLPADSQTPLPIRYFTLAMQDSVLFEVVVTLAIASLSLRYDPGARPNEHVLFHQTRGMNGLRQKLGARPGLADDASICSILCLIGIAYMYGDFAVIEPHMIALRQMVNIRGGINNLGWRGFLKNSITILEAAWAYRVNKAITIGRTEEQATATYPKHPFSPQLCEEIARLPVGFGDLAMTGSLSLQIINLLSSVHEWISGINKRQSEPVTDFTSFEALAQKLAQRAVELMALANLQDLDRIISIAILACAMETFKTRGAPNTVHRRTLRTYCETFDRFKLSEIDQECLTWVALMVAEPVAEEDQGTSPPDRIIRYETSDESPRNMLLKKVMLINRRSLKWSWVSNTIQRFFYTDRVLVERRRVWEYALARRAYP